MENTTSLTNVSDLQNEWQHFISTRDARSSGVRSVVASSWERCRSYNIDPILNANTVVVGTELAERIKNNQHLIKIARPFMEKIYAFLKGSGFQVVLTDAEGLILDVIGDPTIINRSKIVQLAPGGHWGEQVKGTNAIGTAIVEQSPVQIYAMEHYVRDNHFLTCSAAPIFDPDGRICGVLDVSGYYQYANPHTLSLVVAAAAAIENQIRLRKATSSLYYAYKYSNTIMESMAEGLLSIDNNGVITRINSRGSKILELKPEECVGRSVEVVFNQRLPMLDILKSGESYADKEVRINLHGKEKVVLSTATPLINEYGNTIGAVAILREPKIIKKDAPALKGSIAKYNFENIIGGSKAIREAIKLAQRSSRTAAPILLQGESGTGKELFAQAIHNDGPTKDHAFVAINCAAVPKDLIESELFGYEEGAFTGAKKGGHPGKFEIANNGTIFLDEIGDMPLETQAKLLRVLQEKTFTRIGGHAEISVDVRIIAATHHDLYRAVEQGKFRLDLYYRINVIPIYIPPLRERGEDIILLSKHLVNKLAVKMKQPIVSIRPDFFAALNYHPWPGNIRELENVLERAVMLSDEGILAVEHLPLQIQEAYRQQQGAKVEKMATPDFSLKEVEKQAIKAALEAAAGNISQAAKKLGIGRNTLYRKMKEYSLAYHSDTTTRGSVPE